MPRWSVVRAVSRFGSVRLLTRTWKYCCIIGGTFSKPDPTSNEPTLSVGSLPACGAWPGMDSSSQRIRRRIALVA